MPKKPGPIPPEFQLRCRKIVDEYVVEAWENEVRSEGDYWFRASELLAAYGYGKPAQTTYVEAKVATNTRAKDLTDDELAQYITSDATTTTGGKT